MDKILLAALLKEWLEDLVNAIHGLEAFPPLRDGRQKIIIEDTARTGAHFVGQEN